MRLLSFEFQNRKLKDNYVLIFLMAKNVGVCFINYYCYFLSPSSFALLLLITGCIDN